MKVTEGDYYSKIPNEFFYSTANNKKSIYQLVKDVKLLSIWDYLYTNTNKKGVIRFTLEDMIDCCGCKPNSSAGRTNDQFRKILSVLQKENYIICDCDISKIKTTKTISCSFGVELLNNFTLLLEKEKYHILTFKDDNNKIDNVKLLMYYCYLKCRMYKRKKGDDLSMSGGRAEEAHPTYELISKDIDLTDETIKKYNNLLVGLDLIRMDNPGLCYYDDDKFQTFRESPNFYTLFDGDEEAANHELREGIKYYKSMDINCNKLFIDSRDYKNNDRSLNGKLGAITKKELNGTATKADILVKNQILESKNADAEEYKFKALLEKNPDKTLSEIYTDMYKVDFADTIFDLEYKFGLVNSEGKLLTDRKYYIWVMTNYQKYDEQHMINCVLKHKQDNNQIAADDTGEVVVFFSALQPARKEQYADDTDDLF